MIAGFDRKYLGRYFSTTHLRVNLPTQRGEAGAPLLNFKGEVVGILVSSLENGSACYALPIDAAEKIRSDYVRFGDAHHGWIGIDVQQADTTVAGSQAEMTKIKENSPAADLRLESGRYLAPGRQGAGPRTGRCDRRVVLHQRGRFRPDHRHARRPENDVQRRGALDQSRGDGVGPEQEMGGSAQPRRLLRAIDRSRRRFAPRSAARSLPPDEACLSTRFAERSVYSILRNSASSTTRRPSLRAFSSLLPASSPARTKLVFLLTLPLTLPPCLTISSAISSRGLTQCPRDHPGRAVDFRADCGRGFSVRSLGVSPRLAASPSSRDCRVLGKIARCSRRPLRRHRGSVPALPREAAMSASRSGK